MAFNWDKFGDSRSFGSFNLDLENTHYEGKGKGKSEFGGCDEIVADDILDRLPADPFGMNMKSTLKAVITGLLQDFEKDWESNLSGFRVQESDEEIDDQKFLKGLNWVWNGTMRFQDEKSSLKMDGISLPYSSFNVFDIDNELKNGGFVSNGNKGNWVGCDQAKGWQNYGGVCFNGNEEGVGAPPHDALFFALGFLGVQDLLVVERVCKSLCDAVRGDALLWRSIHIDLPLSAKITDDALLKLTCRAQGTLQCLSLVGCKNITDDGLKNVLDCNPRLTKLSVPGCVRLSVEGILFNLRAFRSTGTPGIKHLRIGGHFDVSNEQFEELKFLLGADNQIKVKAQKPQFYRGGQPYQSCDDDRAVDIEICPRCEKLRLVYDCPAESCQEKHHFSQFCRACILCIARCFCCGRCIKDCDYEETFCLDFLCLRCWNQMLSCQEKLEAKDASSSCCTVFHQEMYQFCFFG